MLAYCAVANTTLQSGPRLFLVCTLGLICYKTVMTEQHERDLLARITVEPGKMGGKPVIRGRRITPAMVLRMLAAGAARAQVLDAYPVLENADIDACLLYAARIAEQADPAAISAE